MSLEQSSCQVCKLLAISGGASAAAGGPSPPAVVDGGGDAGSSGAAAGGGGVGGAAAVAGGGDGGTGAGEGTGAAPLSTEAVVAVLKAVAGSSKQLSHHYCGLGRLPGVKQLGKGVIRELMQLVEQSGGNAIAEAAKLQLLVALMGMAAKRVAHVGP